MRALIKSGLSGSFRGGAQRAALFTQPVIGFRIIEFQEKAALYTQVATNAGAIRTGGTAFQAIKGKLRHAHILVLTSINHLAGVLHKAGVAGIGRIWRSRLASLLLLR
ncbi:hypothetical protein [Rhodoferax sp. PAMC 29310]|uniref:hypothetical protein n=1 Tax=Rhodoferax sp. PAMC 29310 TaxID=2822760 RepID=UPI001B330DE8|nr:hypothetical protein [Rhodoferax sp. PAMC 29310]